MSRCIIITLSIKYCSFASIEWDYYITDVIITQSARITPFELRDFTIKTSYSSSISINWYATYYFPLFERISILFESISLILWIRNSLFSSLYFWLFLGSSRQPWFQCWFNSRITCFGGLSCHRSLIIYYYATRINSIAIITFTIK